MRLFKGYRRVMMVKALGSVDGLPWARAPAKKWRRNEGCPTIRELRSTEM